MKVKDFFVGQLIVSGFFLYQTINLYAINVQITSFQLVLRSLVVFLTVSFLMYIVFNLIFRNTIKATLASSITQLLFINFYNIAQFASGFLNQNLRDVQSSLSAVFTIMICGVFYLLYKFNIDKRAVMTILIFLLLTLYLKPVYLLTINYDMPHFIENDQVFSGTSANTLPDIYLIVLDSHARTDIIKEVYGYDNKDFIDKLKERNFYVGDNSRTNYSTTYLTMTALLNMDYLDSLGINEDKNSTNRKPLSKLIDNNKFVRTLKDLGYEYVLFESGWTGVDSITQYDTKLRTPGGINEFESVLINKIPLGTFFFRNSQYMYDQHAKKILYAFNNIPKVTRTDNRPLFVYAHILSPHAPFIFNENGELGNQDVPFSLDEHKRVKLDGSNRQEYKEQYIKQLIYIDKKLIQTVDELLQIDNGKEKIIVIMSDHGPSSEFTTLNMTETGIKEKISILNAIYVPNKDELKISDAVSPVNTFRIVLNYILKTNTPLLENKSYISDFETPYNFIDVTDTH